MIVLENTRMTENIDGIDMGENAKKGGKEEIYSYDTI